MNKTSLGLKAVFALIIGFAACTSAPPASDKSTSPRQPNFTAAYNKLDSSDLTGTYLGKGNYTKVRKLLGKDIRRPAMRLYLDKVEGEGNVYNGVLLEYANVLKMAPTYLAAQKGYQFRKLIISRSIEAFRVIPGEKPGTYDFHNLRVANGDIVADPSVSMTLTLGSDSNRPMINSYIVNSSGTVTFPDPDKMSLPFFQYGLTKISYKAGRLMSTWRGEPGDWEKLVGSYTSDYATYWDGVLELSGSGNDRKMTFLRTISTPAQGFTNPKSIDMLGEYKVSEPLRKMYVLTPTNPNGSVSDQELGSRIGLFLDVFDASAPEAGSHLVTELAFTNPNDPTDFFMYYERMDHAVNVGVNEKPKKGDKKN